MSEKPAHGYGVSTARETREIVLQTACGCEKRMQWSDPLPPEIRVPLLRRGKAVGLNDPPGLLARSFVARGRARDGLPMYVERDEVSVRPPEAPQLSSDEWAAYVKRADAFQRAGENKRLWVEADEEFMRQHPRAEMVCHRSGPLMGAWYTAPSWSNAEEIVRVFSALNAARDEDSDD